MHRLWRAARGPQRSYGVRIDRRNVKHYPQKEILADLL
jgi:hypothetical protein